MGVIQELLFDPNEGRTRRRNGSFTTAEFLDEFRRSSIAYVGVTPYTDADIERAGIHCCS